MKCRHGKVMSSLENAIRIAASAHAGQTDKAGAPYILHPLRVMLRVSTAEERMAAVLHDVGRTPSGASSDCAPRAFPKRCCARSNR